MGVDHTAKVAFGIPVGDMSQDAAESIDESLPSPMTMVEFGAASYGGGRHWILGISCGTCDFSHGEPPRLLESISEATRRKIVAAVKKRGLTAHGELGYYVGGLVW